MELENINSNIIDKVISESYLVSYVTVLIVKIIDFLKEKVLEIE